MAAGEVAAMFVVVAAADVDDVVAVVAAVDEMLLPVKGTRAFGRHRRMAVLVT